MAYSAIFYNKSVRCFQSNPSIPRRLDTISSATNSPEKWSREGPHHPQRITSFDGSFWTPQKVAFLPYVQKRESAHHRLCVPRSRDVAVIKVTMSFEPNKVNIQKKNCRMEGKETVCINATVCFDVKLKSKEDTIYDAGKCAARSRCCGAGGWCSC